MRRLLLIVCCTLAIAPTLAAQQESEPEQMLWNRPVADLLRYHAMLGAYAHGDEANSVEALLLWDEERMNRMLALVNGLKDPFAPLDRRRCGLAVMLHRDLALRLSPDGNTTASMKQVRIVTNLLRMFVRTNPGEMRAFAEQWFYTLARYLRSRNSLYVAEQLLLPRPRALPGRPRHPV